MKGYRKFLWPFMALLEIALLLLNWVVAIVSPSLGAKFIRWNMRVLPGPEWYSSVNATAHRESGDADGCKDSLEDRS
jgi:hypothetical protein